jgi:hypothetical protein
MAYQESVGQWRAQKEAQLLSDDGELTWVGLFGLKEGRNTIGVDASNDIVLPAHVAAVTVGHIVFESEQATFCVTNGTLAIVNGERVTTLPLQSDVMGKPTVVHLGDANLFILKRGEQYLVRVRDRQSEARRNFKERVWFPMNETYRITATFAPHDPPKLITITDLIGTVTHELSPGCAVFTWHGQALRLDAEPRPHSLFFNFRDATSGATTYPSGRFLYADLPRAELPRDDKIVLDFNQAYNPPCAFTDYATCPLPPPQNQLSVPIEAGEQYHGAHH